MVDKCTGVDSTLTRLANRHARVRREDERVQPWSERFLAWSFWLFMLTPVVLVQCFDRMHAIALFCKHTHAPIYSFKVHKQRRSIVRPF